MKTKQLTLLASAIMLCPIGSVAQNSETASTSMVKIEAGVKTYDPTKMGFSQNEPISNVIKMITMYKEEGVSTYSLMVNGENYLQSQEVFFAHTLVGDVERIEIITDPNLCGNTIGTDGNINIVLRNKEEGTHGRVGFQIETNNSHIPAFNISHKADKWTVWGSYVGNISHSKSDENRDEILKYGSNYENYNHYIDDTSVNGKNKLHTFNVGTNYKDERNSLTFEIIHRNISANTEMNDFSTTESVSFGGSQKTNFTYTTNKNNDRTVNDFAVILDWKHMMNDKLSFGVNVSEEIRKKNSDNNIVTNRYLETSTTPYNHTKSKQTKFNLHANYIPTDFLSIKGGVMGKWANITTDTLESKMYSTEDNTRRITPYLLAQFNVGQFKFTAGERYDFNKAEQTASPQSFFINDSTSKKSFNSSVSTVSAEWKPNANHSLMASYRYHKTLDYIFAFYDIMVKEMNGSYYLRNLTPFPTETDYNVYNINYAYNGKNITAGLKAQYTKVKYETEVPYGILQTENRGSDVKLYDVTASVAYHQNLFSIAGDFNFYKYDGEASYRETQYSKEHKYDYTSGNVWILRLTPTLSLPNNFNLSASAMLVSHRVYNKLHRYSDDEEVRKTDKWLTLRMAKSWKNLDLYIKWENAFDKRENDDAKHITTFENVYEKISYNKFDNRLTFGGSFRF